MPFRYDLDCFAESYPSAREKFRHACPSEGRLRTFIHTLSSEQLPLATDVFWQGPLQAANVLVLISATHGVEGFCGSAAQIQWLRHEHLHDKDTAVMMIHALNPYGFAYHRRVNEDNIDLNRNFIDFNNPPDNPRYPPLSTALLPDNRQQFSDSDRILENYRRQYGQNGLEQAVSEGQYQFADGLFYGGKEPSWSHRLIDNLIREYHLAERRHLAVIDIHSGLGPYGYGEIICDHSPASPSTLLAKQWYGSSVTEPACGTSTSVPKYGLLDYAWHPAIGDSGCYVTLEFGTYSVDNIIAVLREENYCWQKTVTPGEKQVAERRIRDFFYPNKQDWQEMVLFRSAQVIAQALHGIST